MAARILCKQEASVLLSFLYAQRNHHVVIPEHLTKRKKYTAELRGFLFCLICRKAAVWLLLLRDLKISAVSVLYRPAMTETSTKWTNNTLVAGQVPALWSCFFSIQLLKEGKYFSGLQERVSSGAACSSCLQVLH